LRARGFLVSKAETARAAEARFRESPPDLAIVDHNLPDGDGIELITAADLRLETTLEAGEEVMTLEDMERRHIEHVVRLEAGNVDRAAVRLGVSRSTLYYKLKRYRDHPA
jgi:DNA-binding NtrC family response regulator